MAKHTPALHSLFTVLPPNPERDLRLQSIDPELILPAIKWEREYFHYSRLPLRYSIQRTAKLIGIRQSDIRELITSGVMPILPPLEDEVQPRISPDVLTAFLCHLWRLRDPEASEEEIAAYKAPIDDSCRRIKKWLGL